MILPFKNLLGLCEGRVPGCLLGYSGSVSPCNIKRGPLNLNTYLQKVLRPYSDELCGVLMFWLNCLCWWQHKSAQCNVCRQDNPAQCNVCRQVNSPQWFFKKYLGLASCNFSNLISYVLHSKFTWVRGWGTKYCFKFSCTSKVFLWLNFTKKTFVCSFL
jgi:hypothetical protein